MGEPQILYVKRRCGYCGAENLYSHVVSVAEVGRVLYLLKAQYLSSAITGDWWSDGFEEAISVVADRLGIDMKAVAATPTGEVSDVES